MLEILLHIEIKRIEIVEGEEVFDIDWESKGIRLDVYVKGDDKIFDLEMQCINKPDLPKRARYYQGIIDVSNLKSGESYNKLKDSYVIFLCLDDLFGKNLPVYTFENCCRENQDILLNDKAYKIFFNASNYDRMETEAEKDFFRFLKDGKTSSNFTKYLENLITTAKQNIRWRQQFMTFEMELNYRYNEGVEQGIEQAKADNAIAFLKDGDSVEKVSRCINLPLEVVQKLAEEIKAGLR